MRRILLTSMLCLALLICATVGLSQAAAVNAGGANTVKVIPPDQRVDINHASMDQLVKVPGLQASWAGRIVRFRPYHSKEDLLDRGILPSWVYDRIRGYIIAHNDKVAGKPGDKLAGK